MPVKFIDATIHVAWPAGKKLGIYQVLGRSEDGSLHLLHVVSVDAFGQELPPRKPESKSK